MRVELYFKDGFVPKEYPYLLYSSIVNLSNHKDELHKGIHINNKKFSLLNMSNFLNTKTIYDNNQIKGFRLINSKLVINCVDELYLKNILSNLLEKGLTIGETTMFVDKVDLRTRDIYKHQPIYEGYIKTLSPILVYNRNSKYFFYNPFEKYFYESIKKNLLHKAKLLNFNILDEVFEMEPIFIERAPRYYKAMEFTAYHGVFKLKCNRELLETALVLGLGQKSAVFGCIDMIEEGELDDIL